MAIFQQRLDVQTTHRSRKKCSAGVEETFASQHRYILILSHCYLTLLILEELQHFSFHIYNESSRHEPVTHFKEVLPHYWILYFSSVLVVHSTFLVLRRFLCADVFLYFYI